MEPFSPHDPLSKLLGRGKAVQPRSNFVQNVVRAARQTPQERGWLARIKGWATGLDTSTPSLAWAGCAVAVVAALLLTLDHGARSQAPIVAAQPAPPAAAIEAPYQDGEASPMPEVETQWTTMERVDALLAVEDTSELTDREIAFLLY